MSERIIYKKCPLCNEQEINVHKTGNCSEHPLYNNKISSNIVWKKCEKCNHVFTEGYYSEKSLELIFSKTNKVQKVGGPVEKNRHISSRIIEKIIPSISSGIWLDVGFGNGSLLFTAKEYGFRPIGLDLRKENVDQIKYLGIEAYCEDLENFKLKEKCSVISLADVLEHTPFPKKILDCCNKLLNDNGILFLSMPNSESIIWDMANENNVNPYWGELEHYHNFSRSRLYSFLEENGFKAVRYGVSERYRVCMEVIAKKNL